MRRMISDTLQKYLKQVKDKYPDPTNIGSTYAAGDGIDITDNEISIDNTVALKTDIITNYEDLTNKPTIPTATSDLNNDSGFITGITSSDVTTALGYTPGTSNFSGSYTDLTDKPTIPDAVSGTNDGTNWTALTIGSDTYAIPQGGGSTYTFTNGLTESSGTVSWDLNDRIIKPSGNDGITFRNPSNNSLLNLIVNGSGEGSFQFGSQRTYGVTIKCGEYYNGPGIIPNVTNNLSLGTSEKLWRNLYVAGNISDGTNSVTVANIATTSDIPTVTNTITSGSTDAVTSGAVYSAIGDIESLLASI